MSLFRIFRKSLLEKLPHFSADHALFRLIRESVSATIRMSASCLNCLHFYPEHLVFMILSLVNSAHFVRMLEPKCRNLVFDGFNVFFSQLKPPQRNRLAISQENEGFANRLNKGQHLNWQFHERYLLVFRRES